ncbi:MAG: OmpA family protein [Pseudomonadota bacterium]
MKGIIFLLVVVLLGWMAGAEYVWLCHVKNHCGNGATNTLAQADPASALEPARDATRNAAGDSDPEAGQETGQPADPATALAAGDGATEPNPREASPATTELAQAEPAATTLPRPQTTPAPTIPTPGADPVTPPAAVDRVLNDPRPIIVTINNESVLETQALRFEPGSWRVALALNGSEAMRDVGEFLANRPELDAVITGDYKDGETNTSSEANLGLARASSVIQALIDTGIARDRLSPASRRIDPDAAGPAISLETRDFSPLLETQLVMFPTGGINPTATPELRRYAADVGAFLNDHRGASLRITGHTDNTGDESTNENLSLARARAVAEYLGELGLPATRLRLAFRGQQEPVASNDTEAGRARNRRVEVQLEMGRR